jgi:hypothetical protein
VSEHSVRSGSLILNLPTGWRVTRDAEDIELVPETGDGAVHFTVLSLGDKLAPTPAAAEQIATIFLESQHTTPEHAPITAFSDASGAVATAVLPPREFESATWRGDLRVVVWPRRAVAGTYVWSRDDEELRGEGLSIIQSIRQP